MKGFKPLPFLALSLYLGVLTACAGHAPASGPGALLIANKTVPDGEVLLPYTVTMGTIGGQGPFGWQLNSGTLPPGLSLSPQGVISGTPPITDLNSDGSAKTYNFVLKVTDSQMPTSAYDTGGFSITINPPPQVTTTSLPNGTIGLNYSATLTNSGGLAPFTWTVTTGTLPAGLTLGPATGTISGIPTGPAGPFPITVQVTDADSVTATALLTLTIVGRLEGNFAFSFNGFDNGQPFYTAASFVGLADGTLSGFLDQNGLATGDVFTKAPVTGTYTIGSNGQGTMTLTFGGTTYNYELAPALTGDLRFILADSTHPQVYGSGVIKAQTLPTLGISQLKGKYAMGFFGADPGGNRSAGAGAFAADVSGNLTAGIEDTNDNGTVASQVAFTGVWVADADFATTGRGTITLNVGTNVLDYAFYVLNPKNELIAVQTDPVLSGASLSLVSLLQPVLNVTGGGFSDASLNGSAVMELNGMASAGPDVQLGVGQFDGTGNITLFQTDENKAGTVTRNTFTGTYNVPTNGRVTVAGLGTGPQPVFYLVSTNKGFVIGTDSSVTQGSFEPQTGGTNSTPPGFSLPQFLISYAGGTIQPVSTNVTNEVDFTTIPAPGGTMVVTYDTSGSAGPQMNLSVSLPYVLDPNNGATTGAIFLQPPTGSPVPSNPCSCDEIVYLVDAAPTGGTGPVDRTNNKWVSINLATPATGAADPNPRLTVVQSTTGSQ
ncbi:MAG: Ig domain-containing protein [Candidatus Korobacteraceae bacterium]